MVSTKPDEQASEKTPPNMASLRRLRGPALLLGGLFVVGLLMREVPQFRHVLSNTDYLRNNRWGWLVFLMGGAFYCALGLPRQFLCFAGGLAYGMPEGVLLSTLSTLGGCLAGFGWARSIGRHWVERKFAAAHTRINLLLERGPFLSVLTLRLLPVGSALLVNLGAGLSRVGVVPFALATLLGSLPQTTIFVLMGSGVRIGHTGQMIAAILLFVVSGLLGLFLLSRAQDAKKD